MNPNTPISYYQSGVVTVTKGSNIVTGVDTYWVTSESNAKPLIGSVFTLDNANYYLVQAVIDDNTIELKSSYIEQNQSESSYLLINNMDIDLSGDDQITAGDLIEAANDAVALAKDWAIKMDGAVEDEEYSSKYNAHLSADSATESASYTAECAASAEAAHQSEVNAAESEAVIEADKNTVIEKAAEVAANTVIVEEDTAHVAADRTAVENAATQVSLDASQVALDKVESADSAELAHDFAVGQNPPTELNTPTDSNNCYYYFLQVLGLTNGVVAFGNSFTPSAAKEYPDKTATSSMWLIQTTDTDGYTFTTDNMAGITCKTGDWFVYYKDLDAFEVLLVSPLHKTSINLATETVAGIAKLVTEAQVTEGTDDSAILTMKKMLMRTASTAQAGVVQLSSALDGSSETIAPTLKALGLVNTEAESATTLANTAQTTADSAQTTANGKWTAVDASTTVRGISMLSIVVDGTSQVKAATEYALGLVNTKAEAALNAANDIDIDHIGEMSTYRTTGYSEAGIGGDPVTLMFEERQNPTSLTTLADSGKTMVINQTGYYRLNANLRWNARSTDESMDASISINGSMVETINFRTEGLTGAMTLPFEYFAQYAEGDQIQILLKVNTSESGSSGGDMSNSGSLSLMYTKSAG